MKINPSKTVQENLLDLIHNNNPGTFATITLDNVSFGQISALTGDTTGKNSQVTVTAIKNKGYTKDVVIKFDRLTVSQGVNPIPTAITIFPTDTQAQRKTKVAAALGLKESEITVTAVGGGDIGTPANEDDTSVSVVVAPSGPTSLYQGASLTIQLTVPDADIPLDTVITNTVMNGFEPA